MKTDIDLLCSRAGGAHQRLAAASPAPAAVFTSKCVYWPGLINVSPLTWLQLQTMQNRRAHHIVLHGTLARV